MNAEAKMTDDVMQAALASRDRAVELWRAGDAPAALAASENAERLLRQLGDGDAAVRRALAGVLVVRGNFLEREGDVAAALAPTMQAVTIYGALADRDPADRLSLAYALNSLGSRQMALGNQVAAQAALEQSAELYRSLLDTPDGDVRGLGDVLQNLAVIYYLHDRLGEALEALEDCHEARTAMVRQAGDEHLVDLAMTARRLAEMRQEFGDSAGAEAAAAESVEIYRRLVAAGEDHADGLAAALAARAAALQASGRAAEARDVRAEAIEKHGGASEVPLAEEGTRVASALRQQAKESQERPGREEETLGYLTRAIGLYRHYPGEAHSLADALCERAAVLGSVQRIDEALADYRDAAACFAAPCRGSAANPGGAAWALTQAGMLLGGTDRFDELIDAMTRALAYRRQAAEADPAERAELARAHANLGVAFVRAGRADDALAAFATGTKVWEAVVADDPEQLPALADAHERAGNACVQLGRPAAAAEEYEQAAELYGSLSRKDSLKHGMAELFALRKLLLQLRAIGDDVQGARVTQQLTDASLALLMAFTRGIEIRRDQGDPRGALNAALWALDAARVLETAQPERYVGEVPNALLNATRAALADDRADLGLRLAKEALPLTRELSDRHRTDGLCVPAALELIGDCHRQLAGSANDAAHLDRARAAYAEASQDYRALGDEDWERWAGAYARVAASYAWVASVLEDFAGGLAAIDAAVAVVEELPQDHPARARLDDYRKLQAWLRERQS